MLNVTLQCQVITYVYIVVVHAIHVTLCPLICTYFTRMVGSWVRKVYVFVTICYSYKHLVMLLIIHFYALVSPGL